MIWSFILDFYCSKLLLAIEIDGDTHIGNEIYDEERSIFLEKKWIQVIRYTNRDVYDSLDALVSDLLISIDKRVIDLQK